MVSVPNTGHRFSEEYAGIVVFSIGTVRGFVYHGASFVGRGGAGVPNRLFGSGCLSGEVALHLGTSSRAILFGTEVEGPQRGRAQAEMVLVPFAETKGTRRVGAKPHYNNSAKIRLSEIVSYTHRNLDIPANTSAQK